MAHFTKEQYEKKSAWASKRMNEQKEIITLTEEQHEVIASICTMRHNLHSENKGFFFQESGVYNDYDFYPADWSVDDTIIEIIDNASLPPIKITLRTYENWLDDRDIEVDDTNMTNDEYNKAYCEALETTRRTLDDIDQEVRNWLAYIDYLYGTDYAPSRGNAEVYHGAWDANQFY